MKLDLKAIMGEAAAAPLHSPYPVEVAVAIVNDCFRMAGKKPVEDATWAMWRETEGDLWPEQLGIIAHFLATTSLREVTVAALRKTGDRRACLPELFEQIRPLTAEMIRANLFRQEELLRRWAEFCDATIAGEDDSRSRGRIEQLDYRVTLKEYEKAEKARLQEETRRRKILEEAQAKEAAARGWRE